jgi:DNA-binding MarR family transcriptional regulator
MPGMRRFMATTTDKTNDFANEVRGLIGGISGCFESYEKACGTFMGVTTSQAGAVLAFPVKSGLTMNELSKAVNLDISTMTRMVDQLVEKGLVERQTDAKDRRVVRVGLTEAGRKLHKKLEDALQSFYTNALNKFPKEEQIIIIKNLQHIYADVSASLEECCKKYCGPGGEKKDKG